LHLFKQLKTIPLFVRYFFNVVDQHSLQSPYIFDFYRKLIHAIQHNGGLIEIEHKRNLLLSDKSVVIGQDYGAGTRIKKVAKEKTISRIARHGISSRKDCIFLFELMKLNKLKTCIELGTSLGIATAYMSKSVVDGQVHSFEGNVMLAERAKKLLIELDCTNANIIQGNIDVELPKFLREIDNVDFVLIDANHTEKGLLAYFDLLKEKMGIGGLMVIDDIRWSMEMYNAWQKVYSNKQVSISIEFLNNGVLIFDKGLRRQHYILSY